MVLIDNPLNRQTSRRALIAGGVTLLAAGCGGEDNSLPTAPDLAPTNSVEAIPTQPPIGSPVAGYGDPSKWAGRLLNIAGWGGDIEDAQETAFYEPFRLATGVAVQVKNADLDRLKEQIDSEDVAWDVLTLPAEDALTLARTGYLEPIDFDVVDKTSLISEVVLQYSVGSAFFSTIIAYPVDRPVPPKDWQEFWEVAPRESPDDPIAPEDMRALRRNPVGTLEFALLADGVTMAELYPLDLERAFTSLDRIRDYVIDWYEDGKQPIELLLADQVAMASAWNVRPWQLGVTTEIGAQWTGGMLSADMWVVPRRAPNKDLAMDFINFATRAIPSANFARLVPFGPVNKESSALLDPVRLEVMPTAPEHFDAQFIQNWAWWADNGETVTLRFEDWLLTEPVASPDA